MRPSPVAEVPGFKRRVFLTFPEAWHRERTGWSRFLFVAVASLLAMSALEPLFGAEPADAQPAPKFVLAWGKKGDGAGEFRSPIGIAISRADEIFVTEFHGDRVQKFSPEGKFLSMFPVAQHPGGIAVDGEGRVYVAPMLLGKICVYGPDGTLLREWGQPGAGEGEFKDPGGIAIGPDGTIYVADQSNHRVQRFTPEGKFLAQWGGHGSEPGQFGGKGKAGARFAGPHFLAFDRHGNLYTTEGAEGRIQKFDNDGKSRFTWGNNSTGPGGFGGREKAAHNRLPGPIGVCVDHRGRVWVSDSNSRVQIFSGDGKHLSILSEDEGDAPGQFTLPHAMAVDSLGFVFIVDASNQRIQKFAP